MSENRQKQQKLRVFCDFFMFEATLCGNPAEQCAFRRALVVFLLEVSVWLLLVPVARATGSLTVATSLGLPNLRHKTCHRDTWHVWRRRL